ncbi:DUF2500 family protein [Terrilactibacillus sp. BCM23-1]|uniref:DUF2500 family protein n=1 Tax=Terrilactibacillus tamarindi TaxID=2599694 RepID=A0A6N8CSC3_9BACI|nr:DUF2500 domain-containing protein [Terrilactibacillus tamarindi]MTT32590.1 DUF2500 family protein [Terrilactibacillus tamarindi]
MGSFQLMENGNMSFTLFITVFFILFILIIAATIIYHIKLESYNHKQPLSKVEAAVLQKRTQENDSLNKNNTDYFVTFQVESGARIELEVSSLDYGQLVDGDQGSLVYQGDHYLRFSRI